MFWDIFIVPSVFSYYETKQSISYINYFQIYLKKDIFSLPFYSHFVFKLNHQLQRYRDLQEESDLLLLGDDHRNIAKYKVNKKVVYNNLLEIECFLKWFVDLAPSFRDMFPSYKLGDKTIEREYLEASNKVNNLEAYYENLGKALSFILFVRGVDIHFENLLIKEDLYPYLFDLECLFLPQLNQRSYGLDMTGIWNIDEVNNSSAVFGGMQNHYSYLRANLNLEDIKKPIIFYKKPSEIDFYNKPLVKHNPKLYKESIVKGLLFGSQELWLLRDKFMQYLEDSQIKTRVVIRPTAIYRSLHLHQVYPQHYQKSDIDSYLHNKLSRTNTIAYKGSFVDSQQFLKEEIECLKQFFIPYYLVGINDRYIYNCNNLKVFKLERTPFSEFSLSLKNYKHLIQDTVKLINFESK